MGAAWSAGWERSPRLHADAKTTATVRMRLRSADGTFDVGGARLTSGVSGERSVAERVHCTPGLGSHLTSKREDHAYEDGRVCQGDGEGVGGHRDGVHGSGE